MDMVSVEYYFRLYGKNVVKPIELSCKQYRPPSSR